MMVNVLEKLRNILFWLVDFAKGGRIRSHIKDLGDILGDYNSDISKEKLNLREEELLNHAVSSTKFYEKFSKFKNLSDFPVISKNTVRDNFKDFISEKHATKDLIPIYTSGSTGTPFKLFQDKGKKERNTADTIFFSQLNGFRIGWRLYFLRLWKGNKRGKWNIWRQNLVLIDVISLSPDIIESFIKRLSADRSTIGIIGYSSALESICRYLDSILSKPVKSNIKSIIAIAEGLNEYTRDSLKRYFNAPVVSRYSNNENGIIAQEIEQDVVCKDYVINLASYKIEIIDIENDVPLKEGDLGRIVITDFYNYGMPLIRYDTGDLGKMKEIQIDNTSFLVLSEVEGRKIDLVYDTKGKMLSNFTFTALMKSKTGIRQYQLIQKGKKNYKLLLNCPDPYSEEKKLSDEFLCRLGQDAQLEIEYVDEIPLLSSGKRRIIVNEAFSE